jgi:Xaa-Pro aminopeptidase
MITDLDTLMQAQDLDAILITGPALHNPAMTYFTGRVHLTDADLVKKTGEDPVLFYNPMERDEAGKTGLPTKSLADYRMQDLLKEAGNNQLKATVIRYRKMLADLEITSGRLGLFGRIDAGSAFAVFSGLMQQLPELEVVGQLGDSILLQALATKDTDEVESIRKMGEITTSVVGKVVDLLASQKARNDILVMNDGTPWTVGDIKKHIKLWLTEAGAEDPEGIIFSTGRDAGVPHSTGDSDAVLQLGKSIVFDIFPCEAGGGYFYDFTRTWCLGYAPDEIQAVYEDVLSVYRQIVSELKVNTPCRQYQEKTCELFESRGHPTIRSNPATLEGYVHGLGHGVGLHVHELPRFGLYATSLDVLSPGVVVTIEPGLYYPERGFGVRVEDTLWVRPDGEIEILADYPYDLVIPVV